MNLMKKKINFTKKSLRRRTNSEKLLRDLKNNYFNKSFRWVAHRAYFFNQNHFEKKTASPSLLNGVKFDLQYSVFKIREQSKNSKKTRYLCEIF